MPGFDLFLGRPAWMLLRFGRYAQALEEPLPPTDFPYALATVHAARGLALLRLGRGAEAEAEEKAMREAAAKVAPDAVEALNPATALLAIPTELLTGELALARGEVDARPRPPHRGRGGGGRPPLRRALRLALPRPPPGGRHPVAVGRNAEAEATFREDLAKTPRTAGRSPVCTPRWGGRASARKRRRCGHGATGPGRRPTSASSSWRRRRR